MILTEEEAKTKWCPFARAPQTGGGESSPSANRQPTGGIDSGAYCLGSACMAWRFMNIVARKFVSVMPPSEWSKLTYAAQEKFQEPARSGFVTADWEWARGDFESPAGWWEPQGEADKRRGGFCGLAERQP